MGERKLKETDTEELEEQEWETGSDEAEGDGSLTSRASDPEPAPPPAEPGPGSLRGGAARKCAQLDDTLPPAHAQAWALRRAQGQQGGLSPQWQLLRLSWATSGGLGPLSHCPPRAPSAGELAQES